MGTFDDFLENAGDMIIGKQVYNNGYRDGKAGKKRNVYYMRASDPDGVNHYYRAGYEDGIRERQNELLAKK